MPAMAWIWLGGVSFALLWIVVGVRIRYFRSYGLLAGYNTAPPEEQARYDVEGLGNHVGNGLITIGTLLALATAAFGVGSVAWMSVFLTLLIGVAFLIVVSGQKFLPRAPSPGEHRMLRRLLPDKALGALEAGTRQWLIECPCGHTQDFWDAGGVRYKAVGEPRQLYRCPACGKARWHKVRKKGLGELGGPGNRPGS